MEKIAIEMQKDLQHQIDEEYDEKKTNTHTHTAENVMKRHCADNKVSNFLS